MEYSDAHVYWGYDPNLDAGFSILDRYSVKQITEQQARASMNKAYPDMLSVAYKIMDFHIQYYTLRNNVTNSSEACSAFAKLDNLLDNTHFVESLKEDKKYDFIRYLLFAGCNTPVFHEYIAAMNEIQPGRFPVLDHPIFRTKVKYRKGYITIDKQPERTHVRNVFDNDNDDPDDENNE